MNVNRLHLIEKFEQKNEKLEGILSKGEALTAEDINEAESLNTELKSLKEKIEFINEAEVNLKGNKDFLYKPVTGPLPIGMKKSGETIIENNRILHQEGEGLIDTKTLNAISSTEYKSAFRTYLRKGEWGLSRTELKSLQVGTDSEGGYLVPEDMLGKIVDKSTSPSSIRDEVTTVHSSRDNLLIPRVEYNDDNIYSNGIRATWTGENIDDELSHQVNASKFQQVSIPVHTAMMSLRITNDMVEDSLFPIQNWCVDKFRESINLLYEDAILNGNGNGMPEGLLHKVGETGYLDALALNEDNALSSKKLAEMAFSIPEQYLQKSKWIMNYNSTGLQLANLKDELGRSLWGMGVNDAGLENGYYNRRLLGNKVLFSGLMPSHAENKASMIFGDLSGYYLVQRTGFSVQVLREVEALKNRLVIVGRLRFGGKVVEPWKLKAGIANVS